MGFKCDLHALCCKSAQYQLLDFENGSGRKERQTRPRNGVMYQYSKYESQQADKALQNTANNVVNVRSDSNFRFYKDYIK
jgi:hypothetical protein